VSGMKNPGTVTATVKAGVATDGAGNANPASTSTDNRVSWGLAPRLDLNGSDPGTAFSGVFLTGRNPVMAVSGNRLLLVDFDSGQLTGATVTFTTRPDGTAETLAVDTSGTHITASFNATAGVLTRSGNATL